MPATGNPAQGRIDTQRLSRRDGPAARFLYLAPIFRKPARAVGTALPDQHPDHAVNQQPER
jgi:hypothetical protein